MASGLSLSIDGGVARLRLTRPQARNSLTQAVCSALCEALTALARDPACRILVVEGSGGSFASGADIAELDRLRGDPPQLIAMYRLLRETQELLYGLPRPTIALIDGFCLGAGLSIALACDLRLAATRRVFAASPCRIGLLYSDSEVRRLAMRIGTAGTRDLLFTGRRIFGAEALRLGLIERLSEPGELEESLTELVGQIDSCSQASLHKTKQQLLRLETAGGGVRRDDAEAEAAFFEADAAEGFAAFLQRRSPRFPGR